MHDSLDRSHLYVTVDILIMAVDGGKLSLFLSRRPKPPYEGRWALPGRFIGQDESAETAVRSLLREMFPVRDAFLAQLYTFTEVNRDPRGRVISAAYLVIVSRKKLEEIPAERIASFTPFGISVGTEGLKLTAADGTSLIGSDLAFDHGRIIETGVLRLQGKIDYTDVGFRFLNDPGSFSLSELQSVFEAVLGKELDASNFRRFIRNRYEETGRMVPTAREEKQGRGRPAALYRLIDKGGKTT